jgi:hypothetical protein
MDEGRKIIEDSLFMSMGIAPIRGVPDDMNKVLNNLPPDEVRRMKRKFRKLWRKFAKHPHAAEPRSVHLWVTQGMGLGDPSPTRSAKVKRKAEVLRRVRKKSLELTGGNQSW